MPIEQTLDGRNIEFPEGYDTPEGRERIVAGLNMLSKKERLAIWGRTKTPKKGWIKD